MIKELTIDNFRGFKSLDLKGFKRVNLIVGKNNVGKTSLLEAISLICEVKKAGSLAELFRTTQGDLDKRFFRWLLTDGMGDKGGRLIANTEKGLLEVRLGNRNTPPETLGSFLGEAPVFSTENLSIWGGRSKPLRWRFMSLQPVAPSYLASLVGKAQRKAGGEERLQGLIRKIEPRVRRIRVDPGETPDGNQVILDIGLSELVPVSQVGQGVHRLLAILADIIGEAPEVALIDEVENGIHHSVLEQIWAGLAETAEALKVQIFATTHSGECLEAAHRAFSVRANYDFSVVQLFGADSGVQGRVLDEALIDAGIDGNIDLR